jgi:hypothetical protein
MARIFSTNGETLFFPTEKKTRQGNSKNTKYSKKSNNCQKKRYRGQGK